MTRTIVFLLLSTNLLFAQADLVLTIGEPAKIEYGQLDILGIALEITNIGNVKSNETSVLVYLTKDLNVEFEEIIGKVSLKELEPNESQQIPFFYPLGFSNYEGTYHIGFSIDPENLVTEADENNLVCYVEGNDCGTISISNDLSESWYSSLLPSPIIFVHGLTGSDKTWNSMISQAVNYGITYGGSFSYCLNPDADVYTSNDGVLLNFEDLDLNVPADIYSLNFDISLIGEKYVSENILFINDNLSNQSGVFRQGKAIQSAIKKVLELTGKEEVILVGHSMGGLACREYIQNTENWQADGQHHVNKIYTLDTPHRGSNLNSLDIFELFFGKDDSSEAIRDLRFRDLDFQGVFLDGGNESDMLFNGYYNIDVNCNGLSDDNIKGLNMKESPNDVSYSCTIANYNDFGIDIVEEERADYNRVLFPMAPLSSLHADRWYINENHESITFNSEHLIKGIDESPWFNLATAILPNNGYLGFITEQAENSDVPFPLNLKDFDDYALELKDNSQIGISIFNIAVNDLSLSLFDSQYNLISSVSSNGLSDLSFEAILNSGEYFIEIESVPDSSSWRYPYLLLTQAENIVELVADFTSNTNEICIQNSITYSDNSEGEASSYNWVFEGGTPNQSNLKNPTIQYSNSGNYDVTLEISNSFETKTITKQNYVNVLPSPRSSFLYQVNNDREVEFENTSINISQEVRYNWIFDDGMTSSESDPVHTYLADGRYNVELNLEDKCGESSAIEEIVIETTSNIESAFESSVTIFPNPTTSIIVVQSNKRANIKIINNLSKNIYETVHDGYKNIHLDLSKYPSGMYYIIIESKGETITKRIAKL